MLSSLEDWARYYWRLNGKLSLFPLGGTYILFEFELAREAKRGNQTLYSQFAGLYRVIFVKSLTVSNVLSNSFPLSWNFNFLHNLTDTKIDLLQRIMSFLSLVFFSPSLVDSRAWSLSSLGLFSVKSFFLALSKVLNPILFLRAKFLWSSKAPSKVTTLAWLVVYGKVNTNDKLQLRRPYKSLCPQWCILCKGNGELIDHLFLHCPVTIGLWQSCSI